MKKIKFIFIPFGLSALVVLLNSVIWAEDNSGDIPLWQVPRYIISAAEQKMPGIRVLSARIIETEKGGENYQIEGVKDQKVYRIQISGSADVLKSAPVDRVLNSVPINSLPGNVIKAAENEIEDFKILNAYLVLSDKGKEIYELIGVKKFTAYYVKVSKEGRVLESGLDVEGRRK